MSERKPGDDILERAMPSAEQAAREVARANLVAFMAAMLRIAEREAEEALSQEAIRRSDDDPVKSRL